MTAIKRTLLDQGANSKTINTTLWKSLIIDETNRNDL